LPSVFIGNVTRQHLTFEYRITLDPTATDERKRSKKVTLQVAAGTQERLVTDLSTADLDNLREHWYHYGLVDIGDLDLKHGAFQGWIMSVDKPISETMMRRAAEKLAEDLDNRGRLIRAETAIAAADAVENEIVQAARSGLAPYDAPMPTAVETEIREEEPQGGFQRPGETHTAEGFRVSRSAPLGPPRLIRR
jgi:hypothetical protein